MVDEAMATPAPGSPETSVLAVGARGDWAPSPATRQGVQGGRVVFADFGRGKVYAVTADGEEVYTFDSIEDLVGKLSPNTVVIDSLPGKFQKNAMELANTGITFLRLKNLGKLSEERKSNGINKTNENDVKLLRGLFYRHPEEFQLLFTSPEELEVRSMTEMWALLAKVRKVSKFSRTAFENQLVTEAHKTIQRLTDRFSKEIHQKALQLPLYRRACEELGLKGPSLAYLVSHDAVALTTLPRDKLTVRYALYRRKYRKRPLRSKLLISLANTAVINKHPRYSTIYHNYCEKLAGRRRRHWKAVLRVALRILRDLHQLAKAGGPPA